MAAFMFSTVHALVSSGRARSFSSSAAANVVWSSSVTGPGTLDSLNCDCQLGTAQRCSSVGAVKK